MTSWMTSDYDGFDEDYGLEKEDDELFNDDYDSEEDFDDDLDNNLDDGFDDDLGDGLDDSDEGNRGKDDYYDASYYEALGIDDGRFDREHHMLPHSGFGSSVNLDELDEDQREAYELGYGIGAEDYDISDKE